MRVLIAIMFCVVLLATGCVTTGQQAKDCPPIPMESYVISPKGEMVFLHIPKGHFNKGYEGENWWRSGEMIESLKKEIEQSKETLEGTQGL